ncbi:MAG: hypothetical protein AAGA48_00700 [Myxococcota bacterium]
MMGRFGHCEGLSFTLRGRDIGPRAVHHGFAGSSDAVDMSAVRDWSFVVSSPPLGLAFVAEA